MVEACSYIHCQLALLFRACYSNFVIELEFSAICVLNGQRSVSHQLHVGGRGRKKYDMENWRKSESDAMRKRRGSLSKQRDLNCMTKQKCMIMTQF